MAGPPIRVPIILTDVISTRLLPLWNYEVSADQLCALFLVSRNHRGIFTISEDRNKTAGLGHFVVNIPRVENAG